MLTQPPRTASQYSQPDPEERIDDLSGHTHRQVIGYLGLALPVVLAVVVRLRPNAATDGWLGTSISAYYWTGAVSFFVGLLAALSLFLLTYRGYSTNKWDRRVAITAGVAAAVVAIFPTTPPPGIATVPWWADGIDKAHTVAATILFAMFAVFSLWLFRKTDSAEIPPADKKMRNAIYLACGIVIVVSMVWALFAGRAGKPIFLPESLALVFFAWSWLVKGRALHSIKSTLGSAKDKMTK
jgi:hypothetical protein